MEFGQLRRAISVDASPGVVFEVVSRPAHIRMWWSDDASFEPVPGAGGEVWWGDRAQVESITVVEVDPPRRFSFRWIAPSGGRPGEGNSLLVTFDLQPSGDGTILRLTESGWRERGWEAAVLEEAFHDHEHGWRCSWGDCGATHRRWRRDEPRRRRRAVVGDRRSHPAPSAGPAALRRASARRRGSATTSPSPARLSPSTWRYGTGPAWSTRHRSAGNAATRSTRPNWPVRSASSTRSAGPGTRP